MLVREAKKRYGSKMWKKMNDSGWLSGITMSIDPHTGEPDIPESALYRAYRAAKGKEIHPLEWD